MWCPRIFALMLQIKKPDFPPFPTSTTPYIDRKKESARLSREGKDERLHRHCAIQKRFGAKQGQPYFQSPSIWRRMSSIC